MKVKSILISQPKPELKNSPYVELIKKFKLKIDFRPFIHIEGKTSREVRQQKIDLWNNMDVEAMGNLATSFR